MSCKVKLIQIDKVLDPYKSEVNGRKNEIRANGIKESKENKMNANRR